MSKKERLEKLGDQAKKFKNVFIKNFGDALNEESLREMFLKHGEITSCVIMSADDGKSKGFGFVAYETHESAEIVSITIIQPRIVCIIMGTSVVTPRTMEVLVMMGIVLLSLLVHGVLGGGLSCYWFGVDSITKYDEKFIFCC